MSDHFFFLSTQLCYYSSTVTDNVTYLNASIYGNETDAYLYDDSYAHKYHKYDHYKADCEQWHGVPVGTGCDTPPYKSDIFFLSFLLFLGTFILAMGLKMFRNTRFLPNKVSLISSGHLISLTARPFHRFVAWSVTSLSSWLFV